MTFARKTFLRTRYVSVAVDLPENCAIAITIIVLRESPPVKNCFQKQFNRGDRGMFDFCFCSNRPQSPCCFKAIGTGCASLVMLLACAWAAHYKKYLKCPRQLHMIELAANHTVVKGLNLFHFGAKLRDGISVPKIKWIGL